MPAKALKEERTLKKEAVSGSKKPNPTFSWTAPMRPFKKRDREFYVNLFSIAGLLGVILFFIDGWMPVVLIVSLIFLVYVMSSIEPEKIQYRIEEKGLFIADKSIDWEKIIRFWLSKRYNSNLLVIETASFPGRMEYVINAADKEKIRKAMSSYVIEEETPPSNIDKATLWFSDKLRV